jgi:glycosyltransferase involved in cell wall biosynthesis
MHQYTADLANRTAAAGHQVTLVTTRGYPEDRYAPQIQVRTPFQSTGTGFSPEAADLKAYHRIQSCLLDLGFEVSDLDLGTSDLKLGISDLEFGTSDLSFVKRQRRRNSLIHITGVHLYNLPLVWALRRRAIPVIHTLHDLDPHYGRRFGGLIRLWNWLLISSGCHLLVHGRRYRERLLARGVPAERVTYAPLLHLFLGYEASHTARALANDVHYGAWALFFGRLLPYKGVADLIQAQARLDERGGGHGVTLAGPGDLARVWDGPLPPGLTIRNRLIQDQEALDLFRHCGLLALPYRDASQSALVAAAYFFRKPVVVTRVGALPELVEEGRTGWVVPPGDADALANCLADALSNPERLARMGTNGQSWYDVQRKAEWETLLAMYESQTNSLQVPGVGAGAPRQRRRRRR